MLKAIALGAAALLFLPIAQADTPVERWVAAAGGSEKLATVRTTYREATIEVLGHVGAIRIWRTTEGKYRKEENIGAYSLVETFDGERAMLRRRAGPVVEMSAADLARARSIAFANASAVYFVAFPERRRGSVSVESDGTIVLKPEGGIEWRVTLDTDTALPRTMVHQEEDQTITVSFVDYVTVDGIQFEREIRRTMGERGPNSLIRFTKTLVNPEIDGSLFSLAGEQAAP